MPSFYVSAGAFVCFLALYSRVSSKTLPPNWKDYLAPEVLADASHNQDFYDSDLTEGDIIGVDVSNLKDAAANAADDTSLLWPNNTVPYQFTRKQNAAFRAPERRTITAAMGLITRLTWGCVKFVERTNEEDYISFQRNVQCSSSVGRIGGRQIVNLAPGCLAEYGTIQHELLHVLGFYHEQSRTDRDSFVIINFDNIDAGDKSQFDIRKGETYGLPYDHESVMHYMYNAFGKNPMEPTIIPKMLRAKIGQKKNLSVLDVIRIQKRFKCGLPATLPFVDNLRESAVWEPSKLSPLTAVDIEMAYECLHMNNPEQKSESRNSLVCSNAVLEADHAIKMDKIYYSPSKAFRLILQTDNNLVLYRECDQQVVFTTNTHDIKFPTRAVMQDDGRFILYHNGSAFPLWGTDTWCYKDSQVFLSDSGYFYICSRQRGCYWRSTSQLTKECNSSSNHIPHCQYEYKVLIKNDENITRDSIGTGAQYTPNNKFYFKKYQGSLAVWRDCDHRQGFKAALTANKEFDHALMQTDGNLVIYDRNHAPLWSSNTWNLNPPRVGAELRLYDNGFLYLCDKDGCYWQSSGFLDSPYSDNI